MRYTYENTYAIGNPVDVFLDGVKMCCSDISEADDDEGYVIRAKKDSEGNLYIDDNGKVATETLYGAVVVTPTEA